MDLPTRSGLMCVAIGVRNASQGYESPQQALQETAYASKETPAHDPAGEVQPL